MWFAGKPGITASLSLHNEEIDMGLLDQILGGIAGGAMGRSPLGQRAGGISPVLVALLPVVLRALSRRGAATGSSSTGGLGGLLGGGLMGGGLGGLLGQMMQSGYGRQAQSWVSTGPNEALPPQAIDEVFGQEQLAQIAAEAGVSEDDARDGLAQLLPEVVNELTPEGQVPADQQLQASVQDFASRLPGGL
jgi:uncharacterized protein YidB (DUF937 family)